LPGILSFSEARARIFHVSSALILLKTSNKKFWHSLVWMGKTIPLWREFKTAVRKFGIKKSDAGNHNQMSNIHLIHAMPIFYLRPRYSLFGSHTNLCKILFSKSRKKS